jgi:hypothetical protein
MIGATVTGVARYCHARFRRLLRFVLVEVRLLIPLLPLPFLTSAVIVISLFSSSISCGILTYEVRTGSWVIRTVFPLIEATLGPKILLAALMSVGVTGQLVIMFELTMFRKSLSDGYPNIPIALRACFALLYARLVKPSRLFPTVFTITTARSVVS